MWRRDGSAECGASPDGTRAEGVGASTVGCTGPGNNHGRVSRVLLYVKAWNEHRVTFNDIQWHIPFTRDIRCSSLIYYIAFHCSALQ